MPNTMTPDELIQTASEAVASHAISHDEPSGQRWAYKCGYLRGLIVQLMRECPDADRIARQILARDIETHNTETK